MFEKNPKFRIRRLLEKEFANIQLLEKAIVNSDRPVIIASSPNERNMTRKTRSRQLRIHSAFQSGYCAICHIPYNSLSDHIQTKRHLKLIGDDGNFISLKGFDDQDTLLNLDGITTIEVKNCDVSPYLTRTRMPRTRTTSLMNNLKDSSLSPTINDSGHHLRSRKHINYMTPPLEDDSLNEKPEIKEYRELRSSSRLLAKLTDQIVTTDEVWNSGRPKRSCNRQRISADERLVADNKTYYKVEVLPSKLRSGLHLQNNQQNNRRAETPAPRIQPPPPPPTPLKRPQNSDKGLIVKFKKLRNSELIRLNNEAENFLFPKKDESCDDTNDEDDDDDDNDNSEEMETEKRDDDDDDDNLEKNHVDKEIDESKLDNNSLSNDSCFNKKIKIEDEESSHSTSSEGKGRKRRRTHAEAFIMDNQKYYKFETPGSRLRYHGSYLSPVGWKSKNNGDIVDSNEKQQINETDTTAITTTITTTTNEQQNAQFNLNEINFSFESVPKDETWYETFRRKDTGDEKYIFLDDDNYWDPLILPYQLDYVPPLDPKICFSTYNQIKKILTEPVSTSTSVGPSTPEPNTSSNSSIDLPQDEDSKISTTMTEISSTSTIDELKPVLGTKRRKKRSSSSSVKQSENGGKNPRKSPRQHASTLAILSSLIQQRKRKSRREITLPTIVEEEQSEQRHSRSPRYQRYRRRIHQNHHQENEQQNQQDKIDYFAIARNLDDELATILDDNLNITETDDTSDIVFNNHNKIDVIDLLNNYDLNRQQQQIRDNNYCSIVSGSGSINNNSNSGGIGSGRGRRRITGNRPGRKPGRKKKKNRTGWPNRNIRRIRRDHHKDDLDDSTLDSMSVHVEDSEDNEEICENKTTDSNSSKQQQQQQPEQQRLSVNKLNSENNNDQSSLDDCNNDTDERITKLNDLNSGDDTVLTDKVDSNVNMQYENDLCVQKLDTVDNNNKTTNDCGSDSGLRRSTSPKRTNRGQRRMPASPKSPRMLRRPRGRWYRER